MTCFQGRGGPGRGRVAAWLLVVLVGSALACSPDAGDSEARAAGRDGGMPSEPAPGFTLDPLDGGEPVSLAALRGKTVVLDFWATWCPPCEFQVPELNAFYDAHRGDTDVAVFGISIDTEGREVVQQWVTEKGVRYPILMGGEDLARKYGAMGFPTTFVVGPDGGLVEHHVGLIETETLEKAVAAERRPDAS